jgi:hypothetical protein
MRPYEQEIKSLLYQFNPEMLSNIDELMDRYLNLEYELLKKLESQYINQGQNCNGPRAANPATMQNGYEYSLRKETIVKEIIDLFRYKHPIMLANGHVDNLLRKYADHELQLLKELREEYGITTPSPSLIFTKNQQEYQQYQNHYNSYSNSRDSYGYPYNKYCNDDDISEFGVIRSPHLSNQSRENLNYYDNEKIRNLTWETRHAINSKLRENI